jgi:hypothetical protein
MKDITLADYIKRTTEQLEKDKQQSQEQPEHNDYEVYPEDDGTDSKRNPYSRV